MANTSTVSATWAQTLSVIETFSVANAADNTLLVNGISQGGTLTASTTPAATKQSQWTVTLSGGAATIDLTAIPGLNVNETIDGSGLKVRVLQFYAPAANANVITVSKAVSNGYGLDAAGTSWTESLDPDTGRSMWCNTTAPTIGSGAKNITVAGTGTQTIQVGIVLG